MRGLRGGPVFGQRRLILLFFRQHEFDGCGGIGLAHDVVMRGQEGDVAAFVAGEGFQPFGAESDVRTGEGHARQDGAHGGLVAAIVACPGLVIVVARAVTGAGEEVGLVADLHCDQLVAHDLRHGFGFFHRIVQLVAAQVEAPDQLPAGRVEEAAERADIGEGDDGVLGFPLRRAIGVVQGEVRDIAADADDAIAPQVADQLDVRAVVCGKDAHRHR